MLHPKTLKINQREKKEAAVKQTLSPESFAAVSRTHRIHPTEFQRPLDTFPLKPPLALLSLL